MLLTYQRRAWTVAGKEFTVKPLAFQFETKFTLLWSQLRHRFCGCDGEIVWMGVPDGTSPENMYMSSGDPSSVDGDTQLCRLTSALLTCVASLRAWQVPKYRKAISRKIINFFIVLDLIITIVIYLLLFLP